MFSILVPFFIFRVNVIITKIIIVPVTSSFFLLYPQNLFRVTFLTYLLPSWSDSEMSNLFGQRLGISQISKSDVTFFREKSGGNGINLTY